MRRLIAVTAGLVQLAFPAMAAENATPLPPGNPAGLTQAQINNHQLEYVLIGVGTVILSIGAVWWINRNDTSTAAATSTSP